MKNFGLLLTVFCLTMCNKHITHDHGSKAVSTCSSQVLTPHDLGIMKQQFRAFPKAGEVAIFRSKHRSSTDLSDHQTYDQIQWTNGECAEMNVVITPLSYYMGFPKSEANNREQSSRDSWRLRAGGYGYDINEYTFVLATWTSSANKATGVITYTKNNVTKSVDLTFEFEMFVVALGEAKKLHPDLGKLEAEKKGAAPWRAAYLVE